MKNLTSWLVTGNFEKFEKKFTIISKGLFLGVSVVAMQATAAVAQSQNFQELSGLLSGAKAEFQSLESNGVRVIITDARGVQTELDYDASGRPIAERTPGKGVKTLQYNELGRLTERQRSDGLNSKISYNESGRLTKIKMTRDGEEKIVQKIEYGGCKNGAELACKISQNDHIFKFAYTEDGNIERYSSKIRGEEQADVLEFSYTKTDEIKKVRYTSGLVVRHHYSRLGKLQKITAKYETQSETQRVVIARNIQFDELGRVRAFVYGNGVRTNFEYHLDSRTVTSMKSVKDNTLLSLTEYALNSSGQLDEVYDRVSGERHDYDYDNLGRLIYEDFVDANGDRVTTEYRLDDVNNRETRVRNGRGLNYSYEADSNRLIGINGSAIEYDELGNIVEDRGGRRAFEYDASNRLESFYKNGKLRATYSYDHMGRRVRKILHSKSEEGADHLDTRYAYSPDGNLLSETGRRIDRKQIFARDYLWLGNIPLAQIERKVRADGSTVSVNSDSGRNQPRVTYIESDRMGVPKQGRDANGEIVWRWVRDAYGSGAGKQVRAERLGVDQDPDGDGRSVKIPLRLPGQYHDRESNLYYNHNRDYDPRTGRYIQSDPLGLAAGSNRYTYVVADPVNKYDPTGLNYVCYGTAGSYSSVETEGDPENENDLGGIEVTYEPGTYECIYVPGANPTPYQPSTPYVPTPSAPPATTTPTPPPEPNKKKKKSECTPEDDAVADAVRDAFRNANSSSQEYGGLIVRLADNSIVSLPAPPGAPFVPGANPTVDIFNVTVPAGATVLGGYHTHPSGTVTGADGYDYTSGQYFSPDDFLIASPGSAYIGSPYGPVYGGVPNAYVPSWNGLSLATNIGSNVQIFTMPNGSATGLIPTGSSADLRALMVANAVDISVCGK